MLRNKLKLLIMSVLGVFMFATMAPVPAIMAAPKDQICQGVNFVDGSTGCSGPKGAKGVGDVVASIINILSLVVGILAVIFVIIGGLKFITSSGDPANVSSARNTIIYALVGLVIVALAQVIVRFVLNRAT
jgi:hypothetical protein